MKKIFFLILFLFLIIFAFRLHQTLTVKPTPSISELQKEAGVPVEVLVVRAQKFSREILVTGTVGSEEEANIAPKIGGRVISVNAEPGMQVTKKQVLVVIDDSQLQIQKAQIQNQIMMVQANVDSIKIQIDDAVRDVRRMEELYKENVISQKQLEGYQLKLETLRKNYEAGQKNLQVVMENLQLINTQIEDCIIRAPFDGIIGNKRVEIGEMVGPGQVLMTIYNTKKLNAQMKVPEVYIPQIKKGQDVEIEIDALGQETIIGKVTKISGAPDPKTKMFIVYISLPSRDTLIKPGMFVKGRIIITRKNNTFIIPAQAIFEEAGKKIVYIVKNQVVHKTEITVGQEINGKIEVLSGLSNGDLVVISGKENLSSGTKVTIINEISSQ
ncbi:MAG: efflux RND transporter periplasmic adaptor subunit [bacterium]|nr:efflux RND transporter periplasmic adaptor subunit [bacterium]